VPVAILVFSLKKFGVCGMQFTALASRSIGAIEQAALGAYIT